MFTRTQHCPTRVKSEKYQHEVNDVKSTEYQEQGGHGTASEIQICQIKTRKAIGTATG